MKNKKLNQVIVKRFFTGHTKQSLPKAFQGCDRKRIHINGDLWFTSLTRTLFRVKSVNSVVYKINLDLYTSICRWLCPFMVYNFENRNITVGHNILTIPQNKFHPKEKKEENNNVCISLYM